MKAKPKAPYVIAVILSLAVIVIAYAVFFVPKLDQTAALDLKVSEMQMSNQALDVKANVMKGKIEHLPEATAQVAAFDKSFPSEPSQQDLMASILDAASATGVTVTGINPAAPSPLAADQAAPAAAPAAPAASSTDDPGAPADAPAAQPTAVTDFSKVLATVPLTINASGEPNALVAFMKRIETLKRPITVSEVTLVHGSDGLGLLTMTGQSFLSAPLPVPAKTPAAAAPAEQPQDAPAADASAEEGK